MQANTKFVQPCQNDNKMLKQRSVAVVLAGKAKVPAKQPSVNSSTDEIESRLGKILHVKKKIFEKLQTLLSTTFVDPQQVYKDLVKGYLQ